MNAFTSPNHHIATTINIYSCRVILGPFLLTHLLMDLLVTAAHMTGDARIINVTCSAHDTEKISGILLF